MLAIVGGGLATVGGGAAVAIVEPTTFEYNGTDGSDGSGQEYVVPDGVCKVHVDAYGASAGTIAMEGAGRVSANAAALPGMGGHAVATIPVAPGETLGVHVGGRGTDGLAAVTSSSGTVTGTVTAGVGGFNGGGDGNDGSVTSHAFEFDAGVFVATGGGGGASDVRRGGTALDDRVVVAGGGGSAGGSALAQSPSSSFETHSGVGGGGGGLLGATGVPASNAGSGGGTDAGGAGGSGAGAAGSAGSVGQGGTPGSFSAAPTGSVAYAFASVGGAGGGGWFGGGGGGARLEFSVVLSGGGGGGGSGFGPAGTAFETGVRDGNGMVTITPAPPGVGCPSTLRVAKQVSGNASTGFTAHVTCDQVGTTADIAALVNVDLPFAADGSPDATSTPLGWTVVDGAWQFADIDLVDDTCTITETSNGGADSVSYSCEWTRGADANAGGPGCPGASSGPGADPATVTFSGNGDVGVVTITNTFVAPPTTPGGETAGGGVTAPPVTPAAEAVTARPRFTG